MNKILSVISDIKNSFTTYQPKPTWNFYSFNQLPINNARYIGDKRIEKTINKNGKDINYWRIKRNIIGNIGSVIRNKNQCNQKYTKYIFFNNICFRYLINWSFGTYSHIQKLMFLNSCMRSLLSQVNTSITCNIFKHKKFGLKIVQFFIPILESEESNLRFPINFFKVYYEKSFH